jgi:uridine kinase
LVTIDGYSGSGKTRLARRLARTLDRAPVVHLDHFYAGWDGLTAGVELAVEWVAQPLVAGRPARWRRYDWTADRFADWRETPCAPVVLLEGCGAGSAVLRPYSSTAVWVDTPTDLRDKRLRARIDWPAYAPHRARWQAQEEALFAVERPWEHADAIIAN